MNGDVLPKMPATDHTEYVHVDHSDTPRPPARGDENIGPILSENLYLSRVTSQRKSTATWLDGIAKALYLRMLS